MIGRLRPIFAVLMCYLIASHLVGQITTGSITGIVTDQSGAPLEFASVVMIDIATNELRGTTSLEDGRFMLLNLTPSQYRLEVSTLGYNTTSYTIPIQLGRETEKNISLVRSTVELDEVTISSSRSTEIGNEYSVNEDRIEEVPVILRSIQELTRSNPENNLNSFGGASHRFNNLNIDGVATNDIIGFQEPASGAAGSQANGTPGSLSKTQPIGFGAIKALSLKLTPFDASIGNFNGANIDIVTKNGTNTFENSVFVFGNNNITLGRTIAGNNFPTESFTDFQTGISSGGPIKKDKLFYFTNVEYAKSITPLSNAPGSETSEISLEEVTLVRDHLIENFDYDPGSFESADVEVQSIKVFARLDYIINDKHKLTLRNNYVNSFADNLEWSTNIFNFGNQGFRHNSVANSTVLELKTNLRKVFNKLNVSYNQVTEGRTFDGDLFPHIQIATSSASRIFAGTYREASVYNTKFKTFQITDKLSYVAGNHSLSAGLLFQLNDVDYGFLSAWNGRWEYSSIDNFIANRPSRVRGVYNVVPENNNFEFVQNNPSGTVGVAEAALYVQDKWRVNPNLSLSFGVRVDAQYLTERLPVSPLIANSQDFNQFTNELNNNIQINPRIGFEYNIPNTGLSLSGGTGLFSGKLPFLWFAYIEYISGTDYFNIDIRPDGALPLTESLSDLIPLQPNLTEVNLLDPDFRYPRDWKSNIGIDWRASEDWNFGFDFSYTDVQQGLLFQTLNRTPSLSRFEGADDRLFFDAEASEQKISPSFTNVFSLTNTTQGFRYNATLKTERNDDHIYTSVSYSYGLSKDVSSTVRSSPAANFEWNQAIFGNAPELSFSNYDLRHKINIVQSFRWKLGGQDLLVSALYNGRSGSPYSFVYQGDLNRDGSSRNDLIFVPNDASQIQLVEISDIQGNVVTPEQQWTQLDQYISSIDYLDDNRGGFTERNGGKTPWNHSLDMKIEIKLNAHKKRNLTLSADIFNVLNLLNSNLGKQYFVPNVVNSSFSLLRFEGIDQQTPQFSFNVPLEQRPWIVDTFNSRWRIQFGAKLDF